MSKTTEICWISKTLEISKKIEICWISKTLEISKTIEICWISKTWEIFRQLKFGWHERDEIIIIQVHWFDWQISKLRWVMWHLLIRQLVIRSQTMLHNWDADESCRIIMLKYYFYAATVAVLLNHGAILPCRIEGDGSSGQSWRFQAVGEEDDERIYAHSKVQGNFTSLIQTTMNEFGLRDLVILRTPPSLAGTYTCIAEGNLYDTATVNLIILGNWS